MAHNQCGIITSSGMIRYSSPVIQLMMEINDVHDFHCHNSVHENLLLAAVWLFVANVALPLASGQWNRFVGCQVSLQPVKLKMCPALDYQSMVVVSKHSCLALMLQNRACWRAGRILHCADHALQSYCAIISLCFVVFACFPGLSLAVQRFSQSLQEFQFECIGDAETDDEISIGEKLKSESKMAPIRFNGVIQPFLSSALMGP